MAARHALLRLLLGLMVAGLAACGQAAEDPAAGDTGEPTRALVAGPAPSEPPDVDNEPPAGICEDTANILSRVDRDPDSLFRALALDNRVGQHDGDGIRGVRFAVVGDNLAFTKEETTAPYCIFGGNEPGCPPWPRDEEGRYTWGEGGPVVRPGRYHVFVEVFGQQPDSLSGQDSCDWRFTMEVRLP